MTTTSTNTSTVSRLVPAREPTRLGITRFRASEGRYCFYSEDQRGAPWRQAGVRYRALLTAAMRRTAADPEGNFTADRCDLQPGMRSYHIRHSRRGSGEVPVTNPVHVIFYRSRRSGLVEIVRVLHERTDPVRHIGAEPGS